MRLQGLSLKNNIIKPEISGIENLRSDTKKNFLKLLIKNIKQHYTLYLFSLPALIIYIVFAYYPMYGVQIAFKNFNATLGITGSQWVGFEHFIRFFNSNQFLVVLINTLYISLYSLIAGFPIPILFALMLNEVKVIGFKKSMQMITYAPHFISTVVLVGMVLIFLEEPNGLVNRIIGLFGISAIDYISNPNMFSNIYVWSGIWQGMGWASIIYISALSSIDPQLHEAAIVDGANKIQRIWHINIPGIMPIIVIQLILSCGGILGVGFEKVFLMQNLLNLSASEVISTYVYKVGIAGADFSFSSAVGLFNSVINFIILISVNYIAKKLGGEGLW